MMTLKSAGKVTLMERVETTSLTSHGMTFCWISIPDGTGVSVWTYVEMIRTFTVKDDQLVAVAINGVDCGQIEIGSHVLETECLKEAQRIPFMNG